MNWTCFVFGHDWNYNKKPTHEWSIKTRGPCQYTAVCDRCGAELFQDQTDEFRFHNHIIEKMQEKDTQ